MLTQFVVAQQIPIDSISYEYFYEKELEQIVLLKKSQKNKPFDANKYIDIGELYQSINSEDSAYASYYKVYEYEKQKKTLRKNKFRELLFSLHSVESSKKDYDKDRRFFLTELKELTEKDNTDKWHAKIENELFKDYFSDSLKIKLAKEKINIIKETDYYKIDNEFRSIILLNEGNLNTKLNNFDKAENSLFQALEFASQNKDYLRQVYCLINLGANENKRKNYRKALSYFAQTNNIPNKKHKLKIERFLANNRGNAYYGLKDSINLKYQDALRDKLDVVIDDFKKNSSFYETDVRYQTKEKDRKIKELTKVETKLNKNRIIYSILLFGVFLLALYSFVRWKKSDRKKKVLDQQNQSLNLENKKAKTELETVKSLVINDYVVLKNKSKVYLKELIYVKSDGHYLNLYTTSKKEFVRGKISEIEQQLPPNFIKCHRSHIVNENFIKQYSSKEVFMVNGAHIPLSRGFKF
ncbi:LytTR family transcriptional regulator [Lacinutrix sp.]|uniref:LytTR family transcriptional regulator n=1 Tax=Lacinutrix sp. TaxID=1937692 RepID=UPI0025C3BB65|nr:LytTR family transcriptional regulator [Lacinutrix sp.]